MRLDSKHLWLPNWRRWSVCAIMLVTLILPACRSGITPAPWAESPTNTLPTATNQGLPNQQPGDGAVGTGVRAPATIVSPQSGQRSPALPLSHGVGGPGGISQQSLNQVALVNHETPVAAGSEVGARSAIVSSPFVGRTDGAPIDDCYCCPPTEGYAQTPYAPYQWAQVPGAPLPKRKEEYLCDGGDRNTSAAIGRDWSIRGLDIEDTVAHFDTLAGERTVEASDRVCIYAPRFGSVRKVYGILQDQTYDHMGHTAQTTSLVADTDSSGSILAHQNLQPHGQSGRKNSSVFLDQTRGLTVENPKQVSNYSNVFAAYENTAFVLFGKLEQSDKARLAEGIVAAKEWEETLPVQVVVDNRSVIVSRGVDSAQEETGLDLQESRPEMRVVKLASTGDALPGDIVEFTIRFDNIGNEKIGNVTILDNLTPRLEYIEGSAECDLEFDFITTQNEGGSLLLRWEIIDPLEPKTGGRITFKCKVR